MLPTISNLAFWVRADKNVTTGATFTWADLSGAGNIPSVTQSTGTQQPTLNAADSAYAGKPTLSFNGASSQVLTKSSGVPTFAQPYTVIVVGQTGVTGTQTMVGASTGNVQAGGNSGDGFIYAATAVISGSTLVTSPCVLADVFNGASSAVYVNNSQTAAGTGNPGTATITPDFQIGAANSTGASNPLTGKVAEVLLYSRALSNAELHAIFQYLGARYGIATS